MFAVILPGRPCLPILTPLPSPENMPPKFALSFPLLPKFSHIVVFMLPGNTLPPEAAAAVYLQLPGQPDFKLLGAIANDKQSAIFKLNLPGVGEDGYGDAMTDAMNGGAAGPMVNLGISVELATDVQAQLTSLKSGNALVPSATRTSALSPSSTSPPSTKVLAQRIIQNAFNFLSSFSGTMANGQEVVPLKSFQDWWVKFERRVQNDPGFLERPQD